MALRQHQARTRLTRENSRDDGADRTRFAPGPHEWSRARERNGRRFCRSDPQRDAGQTPAPHDARDSLVTERTIPQRTVVNADAFAWMAAHPAHAIERAPIAVITSLSDVLELLLPFPA